VLRAKLLRGRLLLDKPSFSDFCTSRNLMTATKTLLHVSFGITIPGMGFNRATKQRQSSHSGPECTDVDCRYDRLCTSDISRRTSTPLSCLIRHLSQTRGSLACIWSPCRPDEGRALVANHGTEGAKLGQDHALQVRAIQLGYHTSSDSCAYFRR